MNEIAIRCKSIKKYYGPPENRVEALKGIDLDIFKGQLTLLVGPSGSGKTTLLSIFANILTPDEGQLWLLGKDTSKMSEKEKTNFCKDQLGIVFQSYFLVPSLNLADNVALPLLIDGISQKEAQKRAIEMLKRFHLDQRYLSSPTLLSKGQQQRVAIARAMIKDASIILCDEPTSSLDHTAGMEVMALLRNLAKDFSKAVLVVTHDHRIFECADRVVNIDDGQIIEDETV
ncbi:MAG: ABC transporter ATP-binding protein [Parachlamydiaceae bacterium]|nr:ABC transporter ATP-binding protein [Parachlamydiaceae bacterium]